MFFFLTLVLVNPVYRFILHPGQFAPRGWSCLRAACPPGCPPPTLGSLPPGVKLPLGSLPPPPRGEDTVAWAACSPPQENLTELNAGRFYVFKIKILIIETWENWFLHVCPCASFSWYEEIEGQNIVALEVCTYARKPGRLSSKGQFIT